MRFCVWREGLGSAGSPPLILPLPFNTLPISLNTKMWPWQHIFTFKRDPNQLHFPPLILVLSPLPSLAPHLLPSLSPLPSIPFPSPFFPPSVILIIFIISFLGIFPFFSYI